LDHTWWYLSNYPFENVSVTHTSFTCRCIQTDKFNGPEGDMNIVYELAERALDEVVNGRLEESITQVIDSSTMHRLCK